jgi:PPM family protein phosphatase
MVCLKCGASVNIGDNFCEECGSSLKQTSSSRNPGLGELHKSTVVVCDNNLASVTNIGRRHLKNEDSGTAARTKNEGSILIVADGVSSSFSATSASQMAIEVIKEILLSSNGTARELITSAIHAADVRIRELPFETREDGIYGPEATVVVALVHENTATIGWVGDSRAYVLNKDSQMKLTVDDSWVESVVADGRMTREEASQDKLAHCVTQVLGMHDQEIEVHLLECELRVGDMLLLCSDGLWNYFQGENALLKAITAFGINSDAVYICEHLVNLANFAGGHDNITVSLLRVQ